MALIQVSGLVTIPAGSTSGSVLVDAVPGYVRRVFATTNPAYGDGAVSSATLASVLATRADFMPFRYAVDSYGWSDVISQQPFSGAIERSASGARPRLNFVATLAAPAPIGGAVVQVGVSIETGPDADDKG